MQSIVRLLAAIVFLIFISSRLAVAEQFTSEFGQTFVKIKAGEFIMGTQQFDKLAKEVKPAKLEHLKKELPPHKVSISQDFWLATTEVTQGIWYETIRTKPGRKKRWQRADWGQIPVTKVSWQLVQEFIAGLNEMQDDYHYRLPTEAEWEYAARAGTYGLRPFDYDEMAEYAWFRGSSGDKPQPVGKLKPNAWGL
ncbi:MAG: formylglycine-generating enzyme family protein, partial [Gammaproteobacteria bacterium]|nr:formylglycine-generating enzyme family protein [Gammaproteobacteria bacterium]